MLVVLSACAISLLGRQPRHLDDVLELTRVRNPPVVHGSSPDDLGAD